LWWEAIGWPAPDVCPGGTWGRRSGEDVLRCCAHGVPAGGDHRYRPPRPVVAPPVPEPAVCPPAVPEPLAAAPDVLATVADDDPPGPHRARRAFTGGLAVAR
jgi:hypothetical protein